MERRRRVLPWTLFGLSFVGNISFVGWLAVEKLNAPQDRLGILTRDVEVGSFSGSKKLLTLPKGLTVRDASPQFLAAIDKFEPNRFSILFTTEDEAVVKYEVPASSLHEHQEYYSLDIAERWDDPKP